MGTQPYRIHRKTGWILYLSGKDDDFLDDPDSLVLQELLNDEVTEDTGPNDGEFCVSSHELPLFVVCNSASISVFRSSIYPLSERPFQSHRHI